jgi:hypothetical protein
MARLTFRTTLIQQICSDFTLKEIVPSGNLGLIRAKGICPIEDFATRNIEVGKQHVIGIGTPYHSFEQC